MQDQLTSYSAVLGVVLASKRKELKIEQGQMAEKMGLSQASYSRLESGKSSFSVDQMFQSAEALGLDSKDIFQQLLTTSAKLKEEDISVEPQLRGNATKAKADGTNNVGAFVAGAALGALLVGLVGKGK